MGGWFVSTDLAWAFGVRIASFICNTLNLIINNFRFVLPFFICFTTYVFNFFLFFFSLIVYLKLYSCYYSLRQVICSNCLICQITFLGFLPSLTFSYTWFSTKNGPLVPDLSFKECSKVEILRRRKEVSRHKWFIMITKASYHNKDIHYCI